MHHRAFCEADLFAVFTYFHAGTQPQTKHISRSTTATLHLTDEFAIREQGAYFGLSVSRILWPFRDFTLEFSSPLSIPRGGGESKIFFLTNIKTAPRCEGKRKAKGSPGQPSPGAEASASHSRGGAARPAAPPKAGDARQSLLARPDPGGGRGGGAAGGRRGHRQARPPRPRGAKGRRQDRGEARAAAESARPALRL